MYECKSQRLSDKKTNEPSSLMGNEEEKQRLAVKEEIDS